MITTLGGDIAPRIMAEVELVISDLKSNISLMKNLKSELKRGKNKSTLQFKE